MPLFLHGSVENSAWWLWRRGVRKMGAEGIPKWPSRRRALLMLWGVSLEQHHVYQTPVWRLPISLRVCCTLLLWLRGSSTRNQVLARPTASNEEFVFDKSTKDAIHYAGSCTRVVLTQRVPYEWISYWRRNQRSGAHKDEMSARMVMCWSSITLLYVYLTMQRHDANKRGWKETQDNRSAPIILFFCLRISDQNRTKWSCKVMAQTDAYCEYKKGNISAH